jgi:light-regulated signal transduction histidine kinase (bacteriophytochrome)
VDCGLLIKQVTADLSTLIEGAGAQVTVSGALPVVRAHPVPLGQVFQNLIGNAIKFHGPEPPRVTVSAARDGTAWRLAVADNGIGIDPAYADRVFTIFRRLHSREEYPGTGIGLAICKKIVESYGGTIWLESTPGAGTTFYWTIPDEAAPLWPSHSQKSPAGSC